MSQISTSNIIIKYIYGEAKPLEYINLLEDLHESASARKQLSNFKAIKSQLSSLVLAPSAEVISSILNHSKRPEANFA